MSYTSSPTDPLNGPQFLSVDHADDYNQWRESLLSQLSSQIDRPTTEWVSRDELRVSRQSTHHDGSRMQGSSMSTRRTSDHTTFAELNGRAPLRDLSSRTMALSRRSSADDLDLSIDTQLDLRELESVNENDSNLTCPICQVPFVDPIVLECDHTFCRHCLDTWMSAGPNTDAMKCPTCRRHHFNMFKKASRLVVNMCDEVVVKCPSNGCAEVMARNRVRKHLQTTCQEALVSCKDSACTIQVRRKVRDANEVLCLHGTHSECDQCGWLVETRELAKHKDSCCEVPSGSNQHDSRTRPRCPGQPYGCDTTHDDADTDEHAKQCVFAKLAPTMKAQATMIRTLHDQLSSLTYKNRLLEESFDQLNKLVRHTLRPKIDHLAEISEADVEEIPRGRHHSRVEHRLIATGSGSVIDDLDYQHDHQQLLQLQDSLQHRVSSLEVILATLQQDHSSTTAQHDLALHNHVLGTRQELAYMQGVAHRTQTAVQWLMNRERTTTQNQRDTMAGARGRQHSRQNTNSNSHNQSNNLTSATSVSTTNPDLQRTMNDRRSSDDQSPDNLSSASHQNTTEAAAVHSSSTSPLFGSSRPPLRRSSAGSSQERVKL